MSDKNMPAVEADTMVKESELATYELAFHVLPTIAEGEVETVFKKIKDLIAKHGVITIEEAPARFDLAYEVVKYLEGRNRKFTSAYFGWVRFTAKASEIETLNHEVEAFKELLRYLLVKLTKLEVENPFYFHPAIAEIKNKNVVIEIDEEDGEEGAEDEESEATAETAVEEGAEDKV